VSPENVPSMEAGGMEKWEVWRISCGRDSRGRFIKDEEIEWFTEKCVSPRFDAFTVLGGQGYWRGKPEAVTIFEIAGPAGDWMLSRKVELIARAYRDWFAQECVMVSRSTADVKFV
jgi:hypothetical protein